MRRRVYTTAATTNNPTNTNTPITTPAVAPGLSPGELLFDDDRSILRTGDTVGDSDGSRVYDAVVDGSLVGERVKEMVLESEAGFEGERDSDIALLGERLAVVLRDLLAFADVATCASRGTGRGAVLADAKSALGADEVLTSNGPPLPEIRTITVATAR